MKVKHLKTGNTYRIITDSAIDATNANPTYQKRMVIYSSEKDGQVYCREHGEFWQRFELVKNRCCVCGTTENLHHDGAFYGWRCGKAECMVF